ncbi:aminopeptidase N [Ornithinimicrobium ciconiae]|uniref:Aminopeptidase N n=1 Tax=Ornithinimicrobium ciconiae TaxID=2594265 RepID=A0A516GBL6_9MICO|nr:aminopeptidase N [Ornithinimicrobium ciconiae]QDO88917.1 aminopeptidase N [Ornithinimicrobium ciconiae]
MTATTNLTHAECAERARTITVRDQRVELDLRSATDPGADTFSVVSQIRFAASGPETWVDLIAERVVSVTLNGEPVPTGEYDGARVLLTGLSADNEVRIEADCSYSRSGEGLHRFTDPQDGNTYLYSHCEPTDARRYYPVFEQPDLKAETTFVVTAPRDWVILSGQAEVARTEDDGHERDEQSASATVTFAPTPPLSSYLTAIAAGPYHRVDGTWSVQRADGSSQEVALGVLCRASMVPHLDAEEVLTLTRQGLDFFDAHFDYPYPWGKYDQIFVPEYNIGAMENPGLVTFTEQYLHRGRATRGQRQALANTLMHEMAHMWFGDLVTMRWWDGLWLKESFADLMGYHVSAAATEYTDSWTRFAMDRKQFAYRQDQLPTTHPIVAVIDDMEAARQNFDGITYAKGAAVLKQLMAYVGEEAFFAGSRDYFARHAFGNTEVRDLTDCLEAASGRDLTSWSRVWLEMAGISLLTPEVDRADDGTISRLVIRQDARDPLAPRLPQASGVQGRSPVPDPAPQSRPVAGGDATVDRPHRLVVGCYRLEGERLTRAAAYELDVTGAETEVSEAIGQPADLVLVNDDDLTYASVRLDERSTRVALAHVSSIVEPLSRGLVWSTLWNALRDAVLPVGDYVAGALGQLPLEPDAALLASGLTNLHAAIETFAPVASRATWQAEQVRVLRTALDAAEAGSDRQIVWARALVQATASCADGVEPVRDLLRDCGPEGLEVHQDLRWAALAALAAQDALADEELVDELRRDDTMRGRTAGLRVRAARPSAAAKAVAWEAMTTDTSLTNDHLRALVAGFVEPSGGAVTREYAERYYDSITRWWSDRTMVMASILATGLFPRGDLADGQDAASHPALAAAQGWLADYEDAPRALRRIVIEQADHLARALRVQAAS